MIQNWTVWIAKEGRTCLLLQINIAAVGTGIVDFLVFVMLPSKSCILPCKMLYTVMLHSLYQIIPRKVETKWWYKNLKSSFDFWSVWRIKYVDIVWEEGEKYSMILLTDLRFWNMLISLSYLAWRETSQEKHSVTNSAVYCVTTVFNKLFIFSF